MPVVTLIGRPGCHLCDDARDVVLKTRVKRAFDLEELSIDDHPSLADKYRDHVPVVLLDEKLIAYWHVSSEQLLKALDADPDSVSLPQL